MDARQKTSSAPALASQARKPASAPEQRDQARTGPQPPVRHAHRDRDFGVGYGNSSGYASDRHFASDHADPLFRCR